MSETTLSLPDIPDSKVVLNEREARDVLTFFWPSKKPALQNRSMTLDLRRYAQALLITAVEGSYALGYVHVLYNVFLLKKPRAPVQKLIRKVVRKSSKHWWEHATDEDLEDPKIYETVRAAIAWRQKTHFEDRLRGVTSVIPRVKRRIVLDIAELSDEAWV